MRVCVDIQAAIAQRAGVGRYTQTLVEHLARTADADELALFYFDFRRKGSPFSGAALRERPVRWCPGRLVQGAWKTFNWPPFDWFAGGYDVYHFPNFILPPLRMGRAVVTIHDMGFMRFPLFVEDRNLRYLEKKIRRTVKSVDAIITVSEFSAREIEELLEVDRAKIHAIHEGVGPKFAPPGEEAVARMRTELGLERPYLLTVGTIEPRKNLPLLIEAFEQLTDFEGYLVVVGGRGWKCDFLYQRMLNSPRAVDIRYFGYAEDHQIVPLYAGAELFVFPSLYEGFGLPPLEAMACGAPVVSAAGGSLKEVVGGGACVVDGYEADAWGEAIRSLLADTAARERLAAKGRKHAARYTWDETARKTWAVYRQLV
ncbi:MAG: glycosyltransferase family 4 protein [Kiritimatiellae bacterium]|nr:glycosyltransferase family 4 protein [Kiritimatiellia bacterium]